MPTFTDRELDIMNVLWRAPSTPAEVREALADGGVDLAYNTVQTLLRILQDKGHVTYTLDGRAHRFSPLVRRQDASRTAVRQLLAGLFDRSPELLLSHLVRDEPLDRAALERLRDLVDTKLSDAPPQQDGANRSPRRGRRT